MKRLILILPFLFSINFIQAQFFEHLEDRGYSNRYSDVLSLDDSVWVVTGNYGMINSFYSGAYLKAMDQNGEEMWQYDTPLDTEVRSLDDLEHLSNGNIMVTGQETWCCDCSSPILKVYTFSPAGELINEHYFHSISYGFPKPILTSTTEISAVGSRINSFGSEVLGISLEGDSLWSASLPDFELTHFAIQEGVFVAFSEEQLIRIDSEGNILDSLVYNTAPLDVHSTESGKLLIHWPNTVLELQDNLVLEPVITYANETPANRLFGSDDFVYLLFDDEVIQYDLNYNMSQTTPFEPLPYLELNGIAANEDAFAMVGMRRFQEVGSSYNANYRGAAIKSFSIAGDEVVHFPDVGLQNLEMEVMWSEEVAEEVYHVGANVSGYLKNEGDVSVNSAYLNHYFQGICNMTGHHSEISNLNLAPGDSTMVSLNNVTTYAYGGGDTLSYCIFVSDPSNYYDRNEMNDFGCVSGLFVGVDEIESGITSIFPNPASDQVTFSFSKLSKTGTLQIYDMTGKVIKQQILQNKKEIEVDVSTLPAGMYFSRLISEGKSSPSKKFSVVR